MSSTLIPQYSKISIIHTASGACVFEFVHNSDVPSPNSRGTFAVVKVLQQLSRDVDFGNLSRSVFISPECHPASPYAMGCSCPGTDASRQPRIRDYHTLSEPPKVEQFRLFVAVYILWAQIDFGFDSIFALE